MSSEADAILVWLALTTPLSISPGICATAVVVQTCRRSKLTEIVWVPVLRTQYSTRLSSVPGVKVVSTLATRDGEDGAEERVVHVHAEQKPGGRALAVPLMRTGPMPLSPHDQAPGDSVAVCGPMPVMPPTAREWRYCLVQVLDVCELMLTHARKYVVAVVVYVLSSPTSPGTVATHERDSSGMISASTPCRRTGIIQGRRFRHRSRRRSSACLRAPSHTRRACRPHCALAVPSRCVRLVLG